MRRNSRRAARTLAGIVVCLAAMSGGCAIVTVAGAAVDVGVTAGEAVVDVASTVVRGTVHAAGAAID
ncbi:MAG: hypothetical protein ACTHL1_01610 [Burkholderiaceae bacterium]